jgi:hypothetical protein
MTIKERFKRRKRFLLIGVFIGFAIFAGVGALENKYPSAVLLLSRTLDSLLPFRAS